MVQIIGREEFVRAIKKSHGIISVIADKLQLSWHATHRKIYDDLELLELYEDEKESFLDIAENVIIRDVNSGDVETSKWALARLGRKRGYGEKVETEMTLKGDKPLVTIIFDDEPSADKVHKRPH